MLELTVYNNHRYMLMSGVLTWTEAKAKAEEMGGHLATVTSADENQALKEMISNAGISCGVWLGATDEATEGTWQWETGETWSYTAWASGQPDNSNNEDYLGYFANGDWNDFIALPSDVQGFIVEFD